MSHHRGRRGHTGSVTTRLGFAIIAIGVVVLGLRAFDLLDTELADIASVLAIVIGALVVAIDGESADQSTKPGARDS